MMKYYTKLLISFISFLFIVNSQFAQVHTKEGLQEDISYLFEKIEKIHPDCYWKYSEEYIDSCKTVMLEHVYPMNSVDFQIWLRPKVNWMFDGHTGVGAEYIDEMLSKKGWANRLLTFTRSDLSNTIDTLWVNTHNNPLKSGREGRFIIYEIGSTRVDSIIEYSCKSQESDFYNPLHYQIVEQLPKVIASISKYNIELPVCLLSGNEVFIDTILVQESVTLIEDRSQKPGYEYRIFKEDNFAVLYLNSFSNDIIDPNLFRNMLNELFSEISIAKIETLVIDLRNNGGGNSLFIKDLLSFLVSERQEFQISSSTLKKSEDLIDYLYYMTLQQNTGLIEYQKDSIRNLFETMPVWNGGVQVVWDIEPDKNNFKGDLIVLQSQRTYSASITLCNISKQYELATLVGEPTLGLTECFIDYIEQQLPNSKLILKVAYKQSSSFGSKGPNRIFPDVFRDFEFLRNDSDQSIDERRLMLDIIKEVKNKNLQY